MPRGRFDQPARGREADGIVDEVLDRPREPPGIVAPGTIGPRCLTHSGNFIASIAQASESISMERAVW